MGLVKAIKGWSELRDWIGARMRREDFKAWILKALQSKESYGYEIAKQLKQDRGSAHTGYLYGVLAEMEKEGLIESEWKKGESGPPKKIYRITSLGVQSLEVGLLSKGGSGLERGFPRLKTAILLVIAGAVVIDFFQYYLLEVPPELGLVIGVGLIAFAGTLIFLNLRGTGNWVGWIIAIFAVLIGISAILPPHPTHAWQAIFGFILAVAGVIRYSLGLTLLGFTLMIGTFILHEVFYNINPGLVHDVYTSTAWLVILAAGLSINAVYLYAARGRVATLSEIFSFGQTPSLSELEVSEDSRVIKAPRDQVWSLLADMGNWPRWLSEEGTFRILSHEVVSSNENVVVCDEIAEVRGKKRWSRDKYTLHPKDGIEETYLEGPMRGRMLFSLQDVPGGTKVTVRTEMHRAGVRRLASALAGIRTTDETRKGFLDALARTVA
ncbi:MAG: helix-turn-helix transcriptional regulator [Thaumarchaeota archaeon]|nr:helix-turn-helix transcriptional regulator [Nitrososphaerota archaeon]